MKYIKAVFAIFSLIIMGYFIIGEIALPADSPDLGYLCYELDTDWARVNEDGSKTAIDFPGRLDAEPNELIVIETRLPDKFTDGTSCLCFKSGKQDMNIYFHGELRYTYSTKDTRLFGKTSAVAYIMVPVTEADCGKLLRLSLQTDSSYTGMLYTVYAGTGLGIWHRFITLYGGELIVAVVTLVLGILSILGSVALGIIYKRKVPLVYLGFGVSFAAVWVIVNSIFRQIIFPGISVINDMAFLLIMILPFPFLIYMNELQKERYKPVYLAAGALVTVNFLVCLLFHITEFMDFAYTIKYMAFACVLAILLISVTMIIDIIKHRVDEYKFVVIGILGAFLSAIIQILTYFRRSSVFSGATIAVGLTVLLIFSVINTIKDIFFLEKEKQEAIYASEAKGKFLANMSHEIRTPINAVLGMDAMILRESTETAIREYAMDIKNAGQSLLSLINDILDFSKIESGKMELVPIEYDFSSMIHDIINMIRLKAESKNLYVRLELDENLPSRLFGDDIRIRQILINLLNNAVKYTNDGGVILSVTGDIDDENVTLHFMVKDTGIGIKQADIEKLFIEFERIEEKRNRDVEGTGLGMNITISLLELMESKLKVESVYGSGSCFSFDLKQKIINKEPIGDLVVRIKEQAEKYEYKVKFTAPDAKVLVVDDNAINRKVFRNLLKETKVQIDEAASGFECLSMVSDYEYNIIFMDHMMPEMDGIETLQKLKLAENNKSKNAVVIALTANAVAGAREMYLKAGFDDFLTKPIVTEKLENAISNYLPDKLIEKIKVNDNPDNNKDSIEEEVYEFSGDKDEILSGISELNIKYAKMFNPDIDFLFSIVCEFYKSIDSEAYELEQYYNELLSYRDMIFDDNIPAELSESLRQYRVKVHAMKSSSALIGAMSLSGVARLLEYAANDCKVQTIYAVTPVFLEEWRRYKDVLCVCMVKKESEKVAYVPEIFVTYIDKLINAINDMDIEQSDEIMKAINEFDYPVNLKKLIEQLEMAVTNLDTDSVCLYCERIKNLL